MDVCISPVHPIGLFDRGLALSLTVDAMEHKHFHAFPSETTGTTKTTILILGKQSLNSLKFM
jgi:hypothetical protein